MQGCHLADHALGIVNKVQNLSGFQFFCQLKISKKWAPNILDSQAGCIGYCARSRLWRLECEASSDVLGPLL